MPEGGLNTDGAGSGGESDSVRPNYGGRYLNRAAYAAQEALEAAREDNDRFIQGVKDSESK